MKPPIRIALCTWIMGLHLLAHAAGGGGSGTGSSTGTMSAALADPDYQSAMAAVKTQDWAGVRTRMSAFVMRVPGNADAWNELGHAERKLGNSAAALSDYAKALEIDPKHRGAHEYLGEAYLQLDDLSNAERELKVLDSLCFFPCEQYSDLKEQIEKYKLDHAGGSARL